MAISLRGVGSALKKSTSLCCCHSQLKNFLFPTNSSSDRSEREGKTEEARTAGPIGLAEELEGGGLLLCSKQGGGKEEMEDRDSGAWR